MADMAYVIRGLGYIKNVADIEEIAVGNYNGIPVRRAERWRRSG